jgi:flavodoxin
LKSLVVYYSKSGDAQWVAQTIAAEIGADVEEVVEKRLGMLRFKRGFCAGWRGKETEILPATRSPDVYDLIIVGTPVWKSKPTPAVMTYLKKNNLAGKNVALFFTQENKKPQAIEEIRALIPSSHCLGELSLVTPLANKEESEKQIIEWCAKLTSK